MNVSYVCTLAGVWVCARWRFDEALDWLAMPASIFLYICAYGCVCACRLLVIRKRIFAIEDQTRSAKLIQSRFRDKASNKQRKSESNKFSLRDIKSKKLAKIQ